MFGLTYIKLGVIAGLVAAALIGGFAAGYHWEALEVARLETKYAEDKLEAMQAARLEQEKLDKQATEATRADLVKQAGIIATTKSQLAQVQKNVKSLSRTCVSVGLLRVYNAAILGTAADRVPGDPGGAASAASGVDAPTLGSSLVNNFGACRQNAAQLNALIALLRQYQGERK